MLLAQSCCAVLYYHTIPCPTHAMCSTAKIQQPFRPMNKRTDISIVRSCTEFFMIGRCAVLVSSLFPKTLFFSSSSRAAHLCHINIYCKGAAIDIDMPPFLHVDDPLSQKLSPTSRQKIFRTLPLWVLRWFFNHN